MAEIVFTEKYEAHPLDSISFGDAWRMISHNLGTAVANSSLYSDLIERGGRPERRDRYVGVLVEQSKIITRIIANITELQEIRNFTRERVSLDTDYLVQETGSALSRLAVGRELNLELDSEGELPRQYGSNGNHLLKAIGHLIDNSVAHTPDGGTVAVTFWTDNLGDGSGDYMHIAVGDSGCGMDLETMTNLFKPFSKANMESLNAGLGATIARYIVVDIMGGYITVNSEPEQGTQVTLSVPIN